MYYLLRIINSMLAPGFAIIRTQYNNLTLFAAKRSEMRHFHNHGPNKFRRAGSQLQHAASQGLALHQLRRMHGALWLHIATGHPRRLAGGARWNDHTYAAVATTTHGTAACVYQEGDQEALPAQLAAVEKSIKINNTPQLSYYVSILTQHAVAHRCQGHWQCRRHQQWPWARIRRPVPYVD